MVWCKAIVLFSALTCFTISCSQSSWSIIIVCPWRRAVYLFETSVVLVHSDSHHLSKCPSSRCYFCWLCTFVLLLHFYLSSCLLTHFHTSSWCTLFFSVLPNQSLYRWQVTELIKFQFDQSLSTRHTVCNFNYLTNISQRTYGLHSCTLWSIHCIHICMSSNSLPKENRWLHFDMGFLHMGLALKNKQINNKL